MRSVDELIAAHLEHSSLDDGNSIMGLALALIGHGHYREGISYLLNVEPPEGVELAMPAILNRETARAAYRAATERARPLYERASREMAGPAESAWVMQMYYEKLEMLKNGTAWEGAPDQDSTTSDE